MGKLLLAYDNTIDECTLSGGAWTTGLPLSHLQARQLDAKARSVGADARNTWHYVSAPSAVTVAAFAALGSNLSASAQVRLRGWASSPIPAIDLVLTGEADASGLLTTVRAGSATYIGRDRLLHTVGANVVRFAWDFDTGQPLGLMHEPAATNLLLYSRDLTNAAWSKVNATVTQAGTTGLDGAADSATRITATGSNATVSQAFVLGAAQRIVSVYVRAIKVTGTIEHSADNGLSWSPMALGAGYARFTRSNAAANPTYIIRIVNSGDIIEVDYAQLEAGTRATSAILTTGATASRADDVPRLLDAHTVGASFTAGTIVARMRLVTVPTAGTGVVTLYAAAADQLGFSHDGTRLFFNLVRVSQQAGANGPLLAAGDVTTCAMAWSANDVRCSADGAAVTTDSSANMPTGTTIHLYMGSTDGTAPVHAGYIERVRVYTSALTNAQLVGLSGSELEVPADYDSGWFDAWPAAYISATTDRMRRGEETPALHRPATPQSYATWRVDFSDAANTDGWVEYGRPLLAWNAFQSAHDVATGLGIYFKPRSTSVTTASGARYFDELPAPKCLDFNFHYLNDAEAWDTIYELMRQQGETGEVLVSLDPDDARNLPRHTFLATVSSMEKLRAMAKGFWTKAFTAEQLL